MVKIKPPDCTTMGSGLRLLFSPVPRVRKLNQFRWKRGNNYSMTNEFEQLIKLQTKNRQLNLQLAAIRAELEDIELQMAQVAVSICV